MTWKDTGNSPRWVVLILWALDRKFGMTKKPREHFTTHFQLSVRDDDRKGFISQGIFFFKTVPRAAIEVPQCVPKLKPISSGSSYEVRYLPITKENGNEIQNLDEFTDFRVVLVPFRPNVGASRNWQGSCRVQASWRMVKSS